MHTRRGFRLLTKEIICIAVYALIIRGQEAGELSEFKSLVKFIRTVDPKNALGIKSFESVPFPCSDQWKGVKCSLHSSSIIEIRLENLNLSGIIDAESLCNLPNLQILSLAKNHIHGIIPDSISNCRSLTYLDLSSNFLNGKVPTTLFKLKKLGRLRLNVSSNNLTFAAQGFKVKSEARYTGESRSLQENGTQKAAEPGSAIPPQPPAEHHRNHSGWIKWIPVVLGISFFLLLTYFLKVKAAKEAKDREILKMLANSPSQTPPVNIVEEVKPEDGPSELVFFVEEEERFKLEDLFDGAADLRRQGTCSSLYKVQLNNSVFAVKRLKRLQASLEEFGRVMRKIGNLKHHNILPLVGYNSTNEEKLLIYRYQSNGSLLSLLRNCSEGKRGFPWKLRISMALGIARGLDFIHQRSEDWEIIPHGNIRPSNIMLNENEEPLISEFGYSKFVDPKEAHLFNSSGYTAPEKSFTEQADVFSFGLILLELLTGKIVENSGLDLPKWVRSMVREEWTGEVFDKEVAKAGKYAFSMLNISLKCVAQLPEDRPTIAEVLEKIEETLNGQEDPYLFCMDSVESS